MSADGVALQNAAFAEIRNSTIEFAANVGVNVTAGAGNAAVLTTLIAHCNTGIAVGASTSRAGGSHILFNTIGVSFGGGALRTFCDNSFDGNTTQFSGGAPTNACVQ